MPILPASIAPIIRRSLALAQPIAQATAEAQMNSTGEIWRLADNGYDRTTHVFINEDDTQIYAGIMHVSDLQGGQNYALSGEVIPTTTGTIEVPLSAGRIFDGDVVKVTASSLPSALSRLFRVVAVGGGGAIPSQQVLTVEGQAPSKNTPEF